MATNYKNGDYFYEGGKYMVYQDGTWKAQTSITLQNKQVTAPPNAAAIAAAATPSSSTPAPTPKPQAAVGAIVLKAPAVPPKDKSLRYPNDIKNEETDYVMFQFGRYRPPFNNTNTQTPQAGRANVSSATKYGRYNLSASMKLQEVSGVSPIILYMPQDVQTETKGNWQGKSFSNLGKLGLQASNLSANLDDYNVGQGMNNAVKSLITGALNQVPGVGGNLTLNDTLNVSEGVMLNPNVEVLFDSPELREFSLKFKMTPHDATEAKIIKKICNTFRKASLPFFEGGANKRNFGAQELTGGNVIGVPMVCNVSFMTGSELHKFLPQYKQTVIQSVKVNYTPDGAYSTYSGGSPVATELVVQFLETKLIFAEEINTYTDDEYFL